MPSSRRPPPSQLFPIWKLTIRSASQQHCHSRWTSGHTEFQECRAKGKDLTAEEVRKATGLRYPIERVIARIPRADVQWLIRYAVIARRLTKDFLSEVLLAPLNAALSGNATQDRGRESLEIAEWRRLEIWNTGPGDPAE